MKSALCELWTASRAINFFCPNPHPSHRPRPFPRLNEQHLTHTHSVADAVHNITYVCTGFPLLSFVAAGAQCAASFENIKNGNILRYTRPRKIKGWSESERCALGINIPRVEQCVLDARRFCVIFRYRATLMVFKLIARQETEKLVCYELAMRTTPDGDCSRAIYPMPRSGTSLFYVSEKLTLHVRYVIKSATISL